MGLQCITLHVLYMYLLNYTCIFLLVFFFTYIVLVLHVYSTYPFTHTIHITQKANYIYTKFTLLLTHFLQCFHSFFTLRLPCLHYEYCQFSCFQKYVNFTTSLGNKSTKHKRELDCHCN